jgi:hypothetical protein
LVDWNINRDRFGGNKMNQVRLEDDEMNEINEMSEQNGRAGSAGTPEGLLPNYVYGPFGKPKDCLKRGLS